MCKFIILHSYLLNKENTVLKTLTPPLALLARGQAEPSQQQTISDRHGQFVGPECFLLVSGKQFLTQSTPTLGKTENKRDFLAY